jgi:predicted amidohydrolase
MRENSEKKVLRIACVQMRAMDGNRSEAVLEKALCLIDDASKGGADLVLLPEAFYPSYYLGGIGTGWSWKGALRDLSRKAEERKIYLAAGLILEDGEHLRNAAVLWGPDGEECMRTYKSNLWHFDGRYVVPGKSFDVAETPWGTIGMMICADGRIPEISRILALKGARLILDPTNLVASGRDPSRLSSPQIDYMLPARAAENGVWIAVANKVGIEAESVLGCGGSCVIDPFGEKAASAGSLDEEILFAAVNLGVVPAARPVRTPEKYGAIVKRTEDTEAFRNLSLPLSPVEDEHFFGAAQFSFSSFPEFLEIAGRFLARSTDQGGSFLCLPGPVRCGERYDPAAALAPALAQGGCVAACALCDGDRKAERAVFFDRSGMISSVEKGCFLPVDTPAGKFGVVFGDDGWNPEPIRCLMLEGAETVLWFASLRDERQRSVFEKIARTRASENRITIIASFEGSARESYIVAPSGAVSAAALPGEPQAVFSLVRRSESRGKTVVPGTNIVTGRHPDLYSLLTDASFS